MKLFNKLTRRSSNDSTSSTNTSNSSHQTTQPSANVPTQTNSATRSTSSTNATSASSTNTSCQTTQSSTNAPTQPQQPLIHSIIIGPDVFRDLLYFGYFRTNYKSAITPGIINLCKSFSDYLCYHWIMQPPQWVKVTGRRYSNIVRSPIISINEINFRIAIRFRIGSLKQITIMPEKTGLNDKIDSTTFRFNYNLIVNHTRKAYHPDSHYTTWDHSEYTSPNSWTKLHSKTKMDNIHSMKLEIYPEIFDIRYKDKSKRFNKQAKLYRKVKYKWNIDDQTLKLFKTTHSTFHSPCFGNWVLVFTPYDSDGHSSLLLRLHSIPSLLRGFTAKVTFKYKNQSRESEVNDWVFGFSKDDAQNLYTAAWWDKGTLLSSEFFEMKSLYFIVDIEIITVYPWSNRNRSLPIYQWESYDIINRTYTNIDVDDGARNKENEKIDTNSNIGPVQKDISTIGDTLQQILKKLDALETIQTGICGIEGRLTKLEEKYN